MPHYMQVFLMQYVNKNHGVEHQAKNSIATPTSEITESLRRYPFGKWTMKKIYYRNYYMSGLRKQMVKLGCEGNAF